MPRKIKKLATHLGRSFRKAQPKLRVVTNGDSGVNRQRALQAGAVAVTAETAEELRIQKASATEQTVVRERTSRPPKGKLKELPSDVSVNVFIQQDRTEYKRATVAREPEKITSSGKSRETARNGNLMTARVLMSDLPELLDQPDVSYVEMAETLRAPKPAIEKAIVGAPSRTERLVGKESDHKFGEGILIGIIDVGGFDFAHEDFLDSEGRTRFVSIWDQGGNGYPSPFERRKNDDSTLTKEFDYGSEILAEDMNAAIKQQRKLGLPATELVHQSQMTPGSHATHVTSIAAGNLGVARKAGIVAVLLSVPPEPSEKNYKERRSSFYDSTQIAHAIDYLMTIAGSKQISINISLGTNGHAHDGSSPVCRWIDSWLTESGRVVTVAAGNAGLEAPRTKGDTGHMLGRIHTSGQIAAAGLTADIEWQVIGDGDSDRSENELEIWYSSQDHFSVQVRPPDMHWTEEIHPREYIENRQMGNGALLSVYNERYHPANGLNCISIYLSPYLRKKPFVGSKSGLWKVRIRGIEIRDGRFHGWIERDDPGIFRDEKGREILCLPSYFSETSNVDNTSVNSLACGHRIISVANLDAASELINRTSSQGPTRDGRLKPDIAAPGTSIVAAKGFSQDDSKWVAMSGTSMAAPYVAGVIGLMLKVRGKLTAAQIEGIIQSTANPLPGGSYKWIDSAGFGRINADACIEQAAAVDKRVEVKK